MLEQVQWKCPQCGIVITVPASAVPLLDRAGACQGCRLRVTLAFADHSVIDAILTWFEDSGSWPASDTWVLGLNPHLAE